MPMAHFNKQKAQKSIGEKSGDFTGFVHMKLNFMNVFFMIEFLLKYSVDSRETFFNVS